VFWKPGPNWIFYGEHDRVRYVLAAKLKTRGYGAELSMFCEGRWVEVAQQDLVVMYAQPFSLSDLFPLPETFAESHRLQLQQWAEGHILSPMEILERELSRA